MGEIFFPNLKFEEQDIDFGCILNDTECSRYVTVTNTSRLTVNYEWYFNIHQKPTSKLNLPGTVGPSINCNLRFTLLCQLVDHHKHSRTEFSTPYPTNHLAISTPENSVTLTLGAHSSGNLTPVALNSTPPALDNIDSYISSRDDWGSDLSNTTAVESVVNNANEQLLSNVDSNLEVEEDLESEKVSCQEDNLDRSS